MAITKVTSGVRTLGTGEVTTANMATDPTNASNLSSGSVPLAQLGNAPVTDITGLEDDIAILGFKVAVNGSLAKYNLVDQTVDAFETEDGIDASTSTDEVYNAAGNYYSCVGSETLLTQGGTAPTGVADSMLSVSGFSNWTASVLNDSATGGSGLLADGVGAGSYVMLDLGAGNEKNITKAGMYYQNTNIYCQFNSVEWSTDDATYTSIAFSTNIGGNPSASGWQRSDSFSGPGAKRYWRLIKANAATSGAWMSSLEWYHTPINASMNLVSNSTTAEAVPTKGDLVMTYTNGIGTATINTDIKGYVSRDNGSTYTEGTLVSQGDTGGHEIVSFHDLDVSGQPSGTTMRYKIALANQGLAKETRIQAVSLGWS
jgi:hypothetical protein